MFVILSPFLVGIVAGCSGAPVPASTTVPSFTPAPASAQAPAPAATSASPAPAPVPATAVVIREFAFVPESLTVAAGATVTVDNQDGANHTVTATDGSFDTGNIPGHATSTFTAPTKPGSYPYKCAIHPFMTGTLTVI